MLLTLAVWHHIIGVAFEYKNYSKDKNKQYCKNSTYKNNHYSQVVVFYYIKAKPTKNTDTISRYFSLVELPGTAPGSAR
jgi:hypothetical protein